MLCISSEQSRNIYMQNKKQALKCQNCGVQIMPKDKETCQTGKHTICASCQAQGCCKQCELSAVYTDSCEKCNQTQNALFEQANCRKKYCLKCLVGFVWEHIKLPSSKLKPGQFQLPCGCVYTDDSIAEFTNKYCCACWEPTLNSQCISPQKLIKFHADCLDSLERESKPDWHRVAKYFKKCQNCPKTIKSYKDIGKEVSINVHFCKECWRREESKLEQHSIGENNHSKVVIDKFEQFLTCSSCSAVILDRSLKHASEILCLPCRKSKEKTLKMFKEDQNPICMICFTVLLSRESVRIENELVFCVCCQKQQKDIATKKNQLEFDFQKTEPKEQLLQSSKKTQQDDTCKKCGITIFDVKSGRNLCIFCLGLQSSNKKQQKVGSALSFDRYEGSLKLRKYMTYLELVVDDFKLIYKDRSQAFSQLRTINRPEKKIQKQSMHLSRISALKLEEIAKLTELQVCQAEEYYTKVIRCINCQLVVESIGSIAEISGPLCLQCYMVKNIKRF